MRNGRLRFLGRVPEVIGVGPAQNRSDSYARAPQAAAQIVVFRAPADEVFVVAVDALIIGAPDAYVVAGKIGLAGPPMEAMPGRAAHELLESLDFLRRCPLCELAAADGGFTDAGRC